MPLPQPLYELIDFSNPLDTPMFNINNTSHSPASPTIELNTPIRHRLLYKPIMRKYALNHYFANMALSQTSPFIPIKLPKYNKHCTIIII